MKAAELMRFIIFPGCPKSNKNQVKLFKTIKNCEHSSQSTWHFPGDLAMLCIIPTRTGFLSNFHKHNYDFPEEDTPKNSYFS